MYNDTIKVANKIISYDDLFEIFSYMQEKLVHYKKISDIEERKNQMLGYQYQIWTFKDSTSKLYFDVNFYDDTQIKFDNYNNFISIFNNRLGEIKSIWVSYSLNYSVRLEGRDYEYYNQHINMNIYEDKMDIDISLSSNDKKIDDIYELIKNKVLTAPDKYDEVIKKKRSITTIVGLAIGFVPAIVIATLLVFVPEIRKIYAYGYVVYPIVCLMLAFIICEMVGPSVLEKYYKNIVPEQRYAGYDSNKMTSVYRDDIDKFVTTSEILIGKNINNLEFRKKIKLIKEKYRKWVFYEIALMLIISIIVLFLR